MQHYDFIIAGGGLAGLSLACGLARSSLGPAAMLIVDQNPPNSVRRSWSYWTDQPGLFDPIVYHRWSRLQVTSRAASMLIDLQRYRYEMVRSADLERYARQSLADCPNIVFWQGTVEQILDGPSGARVSVDGQPITAGWVFDSTHRPKAAADQKRQRLSMHARGWVIETPAEAFDPEVATFLDFRTPQRHSLRFFYVLPFTRRQAMVQFVSFAPAGPGDAEAATALRAYLSRAMSIGEYWVVAEEAGSLPLSNARLARRRGPHVLAIGARAGLVKPSTGFGFRRIQQDTAAIVRSLEQTGTPWDNPPISERHRLYDGLLLDILSRRGGEVEAIFGDLFARNPIERVLRFLDEATTPVEDLALIATLPPGPFLEAASRGVIFGR